MLSNQPNFLTNLDFDSPAMYSEITFQRYYFKYGEQ